MCPQSITNTLLKYADDLDIDRSFWVLIQRAGRFRPDIEENANQLSLIVIIFSVSRHTHCFIFRRLRFFPFCFLRVKFLFLPKRVV